MKKKKQKIPVNDQLVNDITPLEFTFKRNYFFVGEQKMSMMGVMKYPTQPSYGFLSKMMNINGTIASIYFTPIDSGEFVANLSSTITRLKGELAMEKKPFMINRIQKSIEDAHKLLTHIDQEGESVGQMGIVILPFGDEEEVFIKNQKKVKQTILFTKSSVRNISFLQQQSYQYASPFCHGNEEVSSIVSRVIPMSSFTGGFPFSSNTFNDGSGYYFGKDSDGGLIILNPWIRSESRTNTNFTIMGVAGVGKSTMVKNLILMEYMSGTKIIIIDPEREYKELTKNLDGDWINAGGGISGKINPLQVKLYPIDEDDEKEQQLPPLALHMKFLETFFKLYIPSLQEVDLAIITRELRNIYEQFGMDFDTDFSEIRADQFPVLKDLYDIFMASSNDRYQDIALLLEDMTIGSDSFMWNGQTSLHTNANIVCIDTDDLQKSSDTVKRTQYFNVLSYAWDMISHNRDERVLLISDEAYLMIDPDVPESIKFLRNASKRARKYETGIAVISHSVVDFLDPKVKMHGQALLDIPSYKILMGADGQNLMEQKELFGLTQKEEEILSQKIRGKAICIMGSKKIEVTFDIPEYRFRYFGKSGGR